MKSKPSANRAFVSKISNTTNSKLKTKNTQRKQKRKQKIPTAVREQTWIRTFGKTFEHKCYVRWCSNTINVFTFQVGHDIPESKGGNLEIKNLKPICSRCNSSMSNNYSIKEWNKISREKQQPTCCFWK